MKTISVAELHDQLRAQGVSTPEHAAFRCVVCGTVQSRASLVAAGAKDAEAADRMVGFSCVGRLTGAGGFDPKKRTKGDQLGCDWSLGGLFTIHEIEVETPDGKKHPIFEPATPEEAQALEARLVETAAE